MQEILEILKTDEYLLVLSILMVLLVFGFIVILINFVKINSKYKKFIKKLGNGNNIEEDLEKFMNKVDEVGKQNTQIINFCESLNEDLSKCIQKVGIVRYSAFKDTGSDLSFAVALLDDNNDGVVFNGIYSREMSNIYAKPVEGGNSKYTLSDEEVEAIKRAKEYNDVYKAK